MAAYQYTEVPVARSQEAIRQLLLKYGARGVQFGEDFEDRRINLRFAKSVGGRMRTVSVTMVVPEVKAPRNARRRWSDSRHMWVTVGAEALKKKQEQLGRATYRALHYWLKSQFEAVDFGLFSFEDVFLAHYELQVDGETTTVGKMIRDHMDEPQLRLTAGTEYGDTLIVEEAAWKE